MTASDRRLEQTLDVCLAHLQRGEWDLQDCLTQFPEHAARLRPILLLASLARQAQPRRAPQADFARNSELRLLNRLQAGRKAAVSSEPRQPRPAPRRWRTAPALLGSLLVAALVLTTLGVARASAASLPGERLYGVKRGLEEARLALTREPGEEVRLLGEYADNRLQEIEALTAARSVEHLDDAVDAYVASVDRLSQAGEGNPPVEGSAGGAGTEEELARHVEVLEGLLGRVPAQAGEAIQRALDRSRQGGQKAPQSNPSGQGQGCAGATPGECRDERQQEQDQRRAEQIARKYGVTTQEVFAVFEGSCGRDWDCVEASFKGAKHKP